MRARWLVFLLCAPVLAYAGAGEHGDPVASVILVVTGLFLCALLGRYVAHRLHQPGVLGELLMGVLLGNIGYFFGSHLIIILREGPAIFSIVQDIFNGFSVTAAVHSVIANADDAQSIISVLSSVQNIEYLKIAYIVDVFSRYGVIFLLFMVGLESSFTELKHTGSESFKVALIGVVAPMILGFFVAFGLLPDASWQTCLFVGATLSATSIGITARVLADLKKLKTREARTILGAAMLDDVLGLIILAAVSSVITQGSIDPWGIMHIAVLTLLFFAGVLLLGPLILQKAIYFFRFLPLWEAKLVVSFLFVMSLAWLASYIQLAAIIGAFAAGLLINDSYFELGTDKNKTELNIWQLISPLASVLTPLFFIVIGLQVKLETFFNKPVLLLAAALTAAAILGKLISGLGANKKDDAWLIGIGMLPRGEVGLVFASIGKTLGVISDALFSAIVLMVVVTTFIAPPLLKIRYAKKQQ